MGLDGVELVMAIEEEFEISIDDGDVVNIMTPRMLAEYVVSRLVKIGDVERRCISQMEFYKIRSVLIKSFGASRKEIRPGSPIKHFLKGEIKTQWCQLREAIGVKEFPKLECKRIIYYPITFGLPILLALLMLWKDYHLGIIFWASLVTWVFSYAITNKMADMVPENFSTVGALTPYVRISGKAEWNHEMVLQRVIQITSIQLDIPAEKIHPDHHFVKDLGLDA